MSDYAAWIGREEHRADRIDPGLVTRWLATLDHAATADGTVPQALHWCLCTPDAATAQLGPDGHPLRDDSPASFLPPVPLPRRMWAASKLEFLKSLHLGEPVSRRSRIASVTEKQGGSGLLVFVDVMHETSGADGVAVREVQSIVYREAAPAGAPSAPPPLGKGRFDATGWETHREILPSEPLLFRFSALTFNSHRIHYDLNYATGEEGYRGLVVHGPLTATLLLDLAAQELGDNALSSFAFRGLSPAICGEALHLVMRGSGGDIELGAFAGDGRQVMSASASSRTWSGTTSQSKLTFPRAAFTTPRFFLPSSRATLPTRLSRDLARFCGRSCACVSSSVSRARASERLDSWVRKRRAVSTSSPLAVIRLPASSFRRANTSGLSRKP